MESGVSLDLVGFEAMEVSMASLFFCSNIKVANRAYGIPLGEKAGSQGWISWVELERVLRFAVVEVAEMEMLEARK